MRFFEDGKTGSETCWLAVKGGWGDESSGKLILPSDLEAFEKAGQLDKHSESWALWFSPSQRLYVCLQFNPQTSAWTGYLPRAYDHQQALEAFEQLLGLDEKIRKIEKEFST